jgi:hypothetical protein
LVRPLSLPLSGFHVEGRFLRLGVCIWCFVILLFLELLAPAPVNP